MPRLPLLDPAALRYAGRPFAEHHAVDDALREQLRARFKEDELLELTWVLAEFIALGHVIYVLGIRHGVQAHARARSRQRPCLNHAGAVRESVAAPGRPNLSEGRQETPGSGNGDPIMTSYRKRLVLFVCAVLFCSIPALAAAQPYIYPNQGQTPQQQESDKGQCYMWAVQQTGFDPANPQVAMAPPPQPGQQQQPQAPQGGLFRGAAGGAALGAVGGAIGGDAGKGAAIGAGVGALFGGMRRARWAEEQQQQQQQMQMQQQSHMAQQQSAMSQGRANYERAFGACMAGRGYTVR